MKQDKIGKKVDEKYNNQLNSAFGRTFSFFMPEKNSF